MRKQATKQESTRYDRKSRLTAILISVMMIGAVGCGLNKDDDEDEDDKLAVQQAGTLNIDRDNVIYSASTEVGPQIAPSAALSLTEPSWESGNILYEIFYLIREYDDERDNGVIDGSNMWKAIHDGGKQVDRAYAECQLFEEKSLDAPFAFGDEALVETYDCGVESSSVNSFASYEQSYAVKTKDIGKGAVALMGMSVREEAQESRHVVQGKYVEETEELTLNQAYLVDYDSGEQYAVRLRIAGNTETGLFTLKLTKGGGVSGISISGYGYSKGENYYLFKVSTNGYGDDINDAYFCFESETTEAEMMLMDAAGSTTVPAECADYEENLPEVDYVADGSDAPLDAAEFTGLGDWGIGLDL